MVKWKIYNVSKHLYNPKFYTISTTLIFFTFICSVLKHLQCVCGNSSDRKLCPDGDMAASMYCGVWACLLASAALLPCCTAHPSALFFYPQRQVSVLRCSTQIHLALLAWPCSISLCQRCLLLAKIAVARLT